jgi:hypothetical protein
VIVLDSGLLEGDDKGRNIVTALAN